MLPIHAYNQGLLLVLLVYDKTIFFCYCNCYCSRMPKAWESAHFIIQGLPLLNFCFLQCPLPLKAKDYSNAFLPTGRVEHSFPRGYGAQYAVYLSAAVLKGWHLLLQTKGVISMTSSFMAVHKAKVLKFLAKLHFFFIYQHEVV